MNTRTNQPTKTPLLGRATSTIILSAFFILTACGGGGLAASIDSQANNIQNALKNALTPCLSNPFGEDCGDTYAGARKAVIDVCSQPPNVNTAQCAPIVGYCVQEDKIAQDECTPAFAVNPCIQDPFNDGCDKDEKFAEFRDHAIGHRVNFCRDGTNADNDALCARTIVHLCEGEGSPFDTICSADYGQARLDMANNCRLDAQGDGCTVAINACNANPFRATLCGIPAFEGARITYCNTAETIGLRNCRDVAAKYTCVTNPFTDDVDCSAAEHLGSAQALTDAQHERAAFCTEGNNLYTHATLCIGADNASDCIDNPFGECQGFYSDVTAQKAAQQARIDHCQTLGVNGADAGLDSRCLTAIFAHCTADPLSTTFGCLTDTDYDMARLDLAHTCLADPEDKTCTPEVNTCNTAPFGSEICNRDAFNLARTTFCNENQTLRVCSTYAEDTACFENPFMDGDCVAELGSADAVMATRTKRHDYCSNLGADENANAKANANANTNSRIARADSLCSGAVKSFCTDNLFDAQYGCSADDAYDVARIAHCAMADNFTSTDCEVTVMDYTCLSDPFMTGNGTDCETQLGGTQGFADAKSARISHCQTLETGGASVREDMACINAIADFCADNLMDESFDCLTDSRYTAERLALVNTCRVTPEGAGCTALIKSCNEDPTQSNLICRDNPAFLGTIANYCNQGSAIATQFCTHYVDAYTCFDDPFSTVPNTDCVAELGSVELVTLTRNARLTYCLGDTANFELCVGATPMICTDTGNHANPFAAVCHQHNNSYADARDSVIRNCAIRANADDSDCAFVLARPTAATFEQSFTTELASVAANGDVSDTNQFLIGLEHGLDFGDVNDKEGNDPTITHLSLTPARYYTESLDAISEYGVAFFAGQPHETTRFYAGIFSGTTLGKPLPAFTQGDDVHATWTGSIQWVISDAGASGSATSAVKDFDLRIDFQQTAIRGVVRRLGDEVTDNYEHFLLEGTFNEKGVIDGTVKLGIFANNDATATPTEVSAGVVKGLIGEIGAVGAFISDNAADVGYAGGFVVTPPVESESVVETPTQEPTQQQGSSSGQPSGG